MLTVYVETSTKYIYSKAMLLTQCGVSVILVQIFLLIILMFVFIFLVNVNNVVSYKIRDFS